MDPPREGLAHARTTDPSPGPSDHLFPGEKVKSPASVASVRVLLLLSRQLAEDLLEPDHLVLRRAFVPLGSEAPDELVIAVELVDALGGLTLGVVGGLVDLEVDRLVGFGLGVDLDGDLVGPARGDDLEFVALEGVGGLAAVAGGGGARAFPLFYGGRGLLVGRPAA